MKLPFLKKAPYKIKSHKSFLKKGEKFVCDKVFFTWIDSELLDVMLSDGVLKLREFEFKEVVIEEKVKQSSIKKKTNVKKIKDKLTLAEEDINNVVEDVREVD